jgi:hypothetical protein
VLDREDRPQEVLARNPVDLMIERGITVEDTHNVVLVSRQGGRTPTEVKAALIHAPDGGVQGMAIVLRDRSSEIQAAIDATRLGRDRGKARATPSSRSPWAASSRAGTPPPNGCSAIAPTKRSDSRS